VGETRSRIEQHADELDRIAARDLELRQFFWLRAWRPSPGRDPTSVPV